MSLPKGTVLVAVLLLCLSITAAIKKTNVTEISEYIPIVDENGEMLFMSMDLRQKLEDEEEIWHWTPWLRTRTTVLGNVVQEIACLSGDSIDSFPDSILTDEQLRNGGFILYLMFGIYAFTLLATVCNNYFIPCVEMICEDLKIPQNVAAATFMSVATSCPEFFVNVISTFLTESDMGIGTIVGSAIFNALGVAAIGGLAAVTPIAIEMRPVTRDVIIYMFNVSILVMIVWDGQVDWYEAVILAVLYILYFVFMFNSMRLFGLYDKLVGKCCNRNGFEISDVNANGKPIEDGVDNKGIDDVVIANRIDQDKTNVIHKVSDVSVNGKPIEDGVDNKGFDDVVIANGIDQDKINVIHKAEDIEDKPKKSIWRFPKEKRLAYKLWWLYTWPLQLLLGFTIPSGKRFYPLAFFMCIVWIGVNSYFVSWSMTVIGHTFLIPDSVMGMTFLAFGGCLPEACSIFIMSRRGEGGIGVSNALGANSLAILFALGLPWLIRTLTLVVQNAEQTAVFINSSGIDFVVGSLLVAVASLWITLYIGKFKLRKSVGVILMSLYLVFITFAVLVETGVILDNTVIYMC